MATLKQLIECEISDFFAGFGHPGEPETPEEMQSQLLARVMPLLAGLEQDPVAYYFPGGEREIEQVSLPDDIDDGQKANCIPLYAAPQLPQPSVVEPQPEHLLPQGSSRDAIRYQFLRDKDAFGNENEPGLAGWDDLAELEGDAFDAAVDARMADADIPAYNTPQEPEVKADAEIYAELYRLRAEIKGPDGFDTWKDAAISEKKARIACEKRVPEIDYLTAMGAFHSDEWHKMGPISGYMKGWNARCAAMLQGAVPVSQPDAIDANLVEALRLVQCMLEDYRERNFGDAEGWIRHINTHMSDYSEAHGDDAYSVLHDLLPAAPQQEAE